MDTAERIEDCPHCGLPVRLPARVRVVRFPDDIELVAAVCEQELNVVEHFCGERTRIPAALGMVHTTKRRVVLAYWPDDGPTPVGAERVADYAALAEVAMGWLREEGDGLLNGILDGSLLTLEQSELAREVTPIRLLAMDLELAYRRRVEGLPAEMIDEFAGLRAEFIALRVEELILQAARESALPDITARMRAALPRSSLDDEAMTALLGRCLDDPFGAAEETPMEAGARIAHALRAEFAVAAACRLTDRPNPRESRLAQLIVVLWRASHNPDGFVDDRWFLDDGKLADYLSPKALWNAAAGDFFVDGKMDQESLGEFQQEFTPLMQRAGFAEFFVETVLMNGATIFENATITSAAELVRLTYESGDVTEPGTVMAYVAERITAGQRALTDEYVRDVWMAFVERGDAEDQVDFLLGASVWLNQGGYHLLVGELFGDLLERAPEIVVASPQERQVHFWTEAGNTMRYLRQSDDAIEAYDMARRKCEGLPDKERRYAILDRNVAIVLRESGQFQRAYELMSSLVEADPEDHRTMHSLALLCKAVGRVDEAATWMERGLAIQGLRPSEECGYLISLAEFRIARQQDDQALELLSYAWNLRPGLLVRDGEFAIAALAIRARPVQNDARLFRSELRELVRSDSLPSTPGSAAAMGARLELALEALDNGAGAEARRILEPFVPDQGEPRSVRLTPVAAAWARLRLLEGASDALGWFRWVMKIVEHHVPKYDDGSFAVSWMTSVADLVEDLLRDVPRAGPDANDLLALYELANGRELGVLLAEQDLPDWVGSIQSHGGRPTEVVALLDGPEELTALVVSTDVRREPVVVSIPLAADELTAAVGELVRFDDANPVAPFRIDPGLANWWRTAQLLVDAIEPHLADGADLVILPGRRLAAAPLHAAGWPGKPWIATRSVSTCPNLRVLLSPAESNAEPVLGVVSVPKLGDTPSFVQELNRTAVSLSAQARVLQGLQATVDSVVELAKDADELVFLCHGITATGKGEGPGICLSAYGRLPSGLLPVEADPSLGAFVLSWSDLIELERAPQVVVSIACATGRTVIGAGGTRLGLEQGFTSRGGGALVSPLWNVGQEGSLQWLSSFYDHHRPGDIEDIGSAHRAACLATMQAHPHPFAWAPFALSRRLQRSSR
ncbi:CHAT domain-containing tetratricopeptide repeat protein [Kribbella soli]